VDRLLYENMMRLTRSPGGSADAEADDVILLLGTLICIDNVG
jgi:hypothetical protein